MSKFFLSALLVAVSLFSALAYIRFKNTKSDNGWICQNGTWIAQDKTNQPHLNTPCSPDHISTTGLNPETGPKTIGGQTDSHGCLIAAGYSWCQSKQTCLRPWEEICLPSPLASSPSAQLQATIAQLLADKHQTDPSQVKVSIFQQDAYAAVGTVTVSPQEPGSKGMFVTAIDSSGNWHLLHDGNGVIECQTLSDYIVSATLVPECYHSQHKQLIQRVNATL